MIIERDCTLLLDRVADSEITITVQEGVRVNMIDMAALSSLSASIPFRRILSVRPAVPGEAPDRHSFSASAGLCEAWDTSTGSALKAALSSLSVRPELVEGSQERFITIIAERNSTVRYEGLYVGDRCHTHIKSIARGSHAEIQLRIGSITRDNQQHIIKTQQQHETPSAISHCEVRSICYGQSRSTYEGMITITKDGQKTEAHQQHKALLIDEQARAYARPSLEVLVDDVQCGHGSAVGQLDEEQLFYLQTRGIALADAKAQLVRSFMHALYTNYSLKKAVTAYLITDI